MSIITDCQIEILDTPSIISGVTINRVDPEFSNDIYALFLEGVVSCRDSKVHRIDFCSNELQFDRALTSELSVNNLVDKRGFKFDHFKAMLTNYFTSDTTNYAFKAAINLIAVPANTVIDLYAVSGLNNKKIKIASVSIKRKPLSIQHQTNWQPLLLTSMGRSGTTWFMHLLREHPEIYIHEEHPHELLMMQYWINMLVSLTSPLESDRLYDKWKIRDLKGLSVRSNVYYRKDVLNSQTLKYLGSAYIEQFADFCLNSIEQAYKTIIDYAYSQALTQSPIGKVRFVSEKGLLYKDLIKELYPQSKHIFLIRDIRDNIASSKAFNVKTGRKGFGEEKAKDDNEFVDIRCKQFNQRFAEYDACKDMAHFVRYEDMIDVPHAMLKGVLEYLELDNSEIVIKEMIERASKDNKDMQNHQTSDQVVSTSGRWKRDLTPELQSLCLEISETALRDWGYEV